jgi:hypothetical protein
MFATIFVSSIDVWLMGCEKTSAVSLIDQEKTNFNIILIKYLIEYIRGTPMTPTTALKNNKKVAGLNTESFGKFNAIKGTIPHAY